MTIPIDPECTLAGAYAAPIPRARLVALWRLDATLGRIAMTAREPALAAMKLLWWRDAVAGLATTAAPADPVLSSLVRLLLPVGISGEELAALEAGWAAVLPGADGGNGALSLHAVERGGRLFSLGAAILGGADDDGVRPAGEGWALVDLARRLGPGDVAERALAEARLRLVGAFRRPWPSRLRPLGMLAVLAHGDSRRTVETLPRQGGPRRIARMIGHRFTGY